MPDSQCVIEPHIKNAITVLGHLPIAEDDETIDLWNMAFNDWVTKRYSEVKPNTVWGEWKSVKACLYRASRTGGAKEGRRSNLCATSPIDNLVLGGDGTSDSDEKHFFMPFELEVLYKAAPEMAPIMRYTHLRGEDSV